MDSVWRSSTSSFFVNEHVAAEKAKQDSVCIDWNMSSESHAGIFSSQKEGMQDNFFDDATSTLSDFFSYLAKNCVVYPHIERHNVCTQFTKNDQDASTQCSMTVSSAEPCTFKVMKRAANVAF